MENQASTLTRETELSDTDLQHQCIALRAYELYEARGHVDGFDVEDWLQAEREILGKAAEPEKAAVAGV
jgi:hypothetical protein